MSFGGARTRRSIGATGIAELDRRRQLARDVGGAEATARVHRSGMLTAPERLASLLDEGSQIPFGPLVHSIDPTEADRTFGDGEQIGFGQMDGRWIGYVASDVRVKGGSSGEGSFRRADAFRNIVERAGLPLVTLMQTGGVRITDALTSTFLGFPGTGVGARRVFGRRGLLLTAVFGHSYAPWAAVQSDFTVMTEQATMSLTAPIVIEAATGQRVDDDALGGSAIHAATTGQVDAVAPDEATAVGLLRRVASYFPANAFEPPPVCRNGDPPDRLVPELGTIVPARASQPYDVRAVIDAVADRDSFLEWAPSYAPNLVTGVARFDGHTTVLLASQPARLAGSIDLRAINKAIRMLTIADDFALPIVTLLDLPGVLPTKEQEHGRLMARLYDLAMARLRPPVPKVTFVLRKGIGFAIQSLSAGDPEGFTFAWPQAEISFMGTALGVRIAFRRRIESAALPEAELARLVEQYAPGADPIEAARLAYLDNIVDPADTRVTIIRALAASRGGP